MTRAWLRSLTFTATWRFRQLARHTVPKLPEPICASMRISFSCTKGLPKPTLPSGEGGRVSLRGLRGLRGLGDLDLDDQLGRGEGVGVGRRGDVETAAASVRDVGDLDCLGDLDDGLGSLGDLGDWLLCEFGDLVLAVRLGVVASPSTVGEVGLADLDHVRGVDVRLRLGGRVVGVGGRAVAVGFGTCGALGSAALGAPLGVAFGVALGLGSTLGLGGSLGGMRCAARWALCAGCGAAPAGGLPGGRSTGPSGRVETATGAELDLFSRGSLHTSILPQDRARCTDCGGRGDACRAGHGASCEAGPSAWGDTGHGV
mmetsp:Transcript_135340/g.320780  ORF Transcript_135340/g.320780 Transcript_135340/m.320780 type:complete len:315 (-) Transcript_135340:87-1031(-)